MRINLEPSYIIHSRPFQDTSLLINIFSQNYGKVNIIARGAKRARSTLRGLLLPFTPLLLSWTGKTELMTLTKAELTNHQHEIPHQKLLYGFYLNELIYKLLHQHDSHPKIFALYENTLKKLSTNENPDICLRIFDKYMLRELGYGFPLSEDVDGYGIKPENNYIYKHEKGFVKANNQEQNSICGISLLAWHFENFATEPNTEIIKDIEKMAKFIINHLVTSPLQTAKIL